MTESVITGITEAAQYHGPGVYLGLKPGSDLPSVLSFYRDLTITSDAAGATFIPMSGVAARGRNPKVFAIGILPPRMTKVRADQQLDRSQSLGIESGGEPDYQAAAEVLGPPATANSVRAVVTHFATTGGLDPNKLGRVIQFESGFKPSAVNKNGVFAGLLQWGKVYWPGVAREAGRPDVTWDEMRRMSLEEQMPFVISYMRHRGITADSPIGDYYRAVAAPGRLGKPAEYVVYKKGSKAVEQNPLWDRNKDGQITAGELDEVIAVRPLLWPKEPLAMKADADSANFATFGSQKANEARRDAARSTDMKKVVYENSQTSYLKSIQTALEAMANAPPLRLLVNPNSFSVKAQKIVSDANWGRNGPIIEFWGDDQDKISGSGEVAGFYALDANPTLGLGGPGLSRSARNVSQAWQNFQSLYLLYRNNGGMYLPDVTQENRLLTTVGSVYLFYDNILYIGCFDSLNIRESDEKPFRAEYDFEFTVRAAFLLDSPPDFDYGGGAAFAGGAKGLETLPTRSDGALTAGLADIAGADAASDTGAFDSSDLQGTINAATDALLAKAGTGL